MRKALITSLALAAVAALVVAASASGRSTAPSAAAAIPGCAKDKLGLLEAGHAHGRRRQPGLPAVVRRRREDEAVEGHRPVQRQGLRVRRRVRGREAARLHEGAGQVDGRAVQQLVPPGQEAVRLLPDPGLVQPGAREGGRLLEELLLRQPVARGAARARRSRRRKSIAALKKLQARRPDRDDERRLHHQRDQAQLEPHVYDTNDQAVQALKSKQIDGIVVDLPTAFYVTRCPDPERARSSGS